jgi:hypothetical protein
MVKCAPFWEFQPTYRSTAAEALCNATDAMLHSNQRVQVKWLVASYFSACSAEKAIKGIPFQFMQMTNKSAVQIGDMRIPVQDVNEGMLYRILFDGFTKDNYYFAVKNQRQIVNAIRRMKRYIIPFIQFNGEFGLHSIRQLRLYALVHDYSIEKDVAARFCGVKLSIFREESVKVVNEKLDRTKAIKLSPSVI